MIRVLIADDEDMIRSALASLLRLEDDLDVVAECRDGESAVAEATRLRPDVCLLDLEMPGLDGVDAAARILRLVPARCIVVTRHARPGVLRRALSAGVHGFVPKSRRAEDLAAVIREVAAGRRYVDPEIAADALSDERCPLTDRELDVLRAGARGEPIAQIAATLHLSAGTVRNHVSSILAKLHLSTRQQAAILARERGWI
ncbi:response regulator transcription factor [Microbacterium sp. RD1]|uniref:response regulator transcription factor n=1 Tax=Microbacterium sp. RD1 TaxID=3457313 RepID=UPI003FA5FCE0